MSEWIVVWLLAAVVFFIAFQGISQVIGRWQLRQVIVARLRDEGPEQ